MAITMVDVARRAGTSTAVVSYVFNDGPRPVAAHTRQRVLAAADELGYRPNRMAAALRSGSSGLIGLVLPDTVNPYFATLGRHLETALDTAGKLTVLANAGYDAQRQAAVLDRLLASQVDGLIIVSADGAADPAIAAEQAGTPLVAVHHRPEGSTAPLVAADNDTAVTSAVAHLHDQHGHERVDFLAGLADDGPVSARLAAWRKSATGEVLRCAYSREAAAELTSQLASESRLPRALLAATDVQAFGVLAAAGGLGIHVPDDLALISCDGSAEAAFTVPSLAAAQQPFDEIARRAVNQLLGQPLPDAPARARLVPRRSCGCPQPPLITGTG
ncbi:LacI family transcriptional regulator [Actinobacteria bacterium YIM 96077]|uniref:LacI family transcriptional regulator n=1 Tax=Phytoactinopolyspora halophila TaxID=1981511 RepID=A0A329QZP7_9ACTN|nr:LacI family DNA-binding transcriptional regulator [Phytoactinopolyspora halophila]AYY15438.1 LacI family transcriptional regulator [Actinobacteria bacterium YIM 96077]RAW17707.1 LacI family transcriptional regulator [Phytoactinopolyspora halophila]